MSPTISACYIGTHSRVVLYLFQIYSSMHYLTFFIANSFICIVRLTQRKRFQTHLSPPLHLIESPCTASIGLTIALHTHLWLNDLSIDLYCNTFKHIVSMLLLRMLKTREYLKLHSSMCIQEELNARDTTLSLHLYSSKCMYKAMNLHK